MVGGGQRMTWLSPDQVAQRLGISKRTATALMYQMNYTVLSGSERKRIRVAETELDRFLTERSKRKTIIQIVTAGTNKKVPGRRGR